MFRANGRTGCGGDAERFLKSAGRAVGLRSAAAVTASSVHPRPPSLGRGRGTAGGDGQKMRSPLFTSGQCCAESGQGNHAASGRVIAYSVETHRLRMSFLHIGGSQTHAKLGSSPEIEITLDNRLYT